MLIRISQSKRGIENYFETGQKQGREVTRDQMDHRVHLAGDLNAFGITTDYSRKEKSWKNHYWHLTASFAMENNDLDDDTLRAINDEMMNYYFAGYDRDSLAQAAEAHRPKIQSVFNHETSEYEQRLLHLHNAVAKFNPESGNQVRMTPFSQSADRAFQSYLCQKYDLVDPADRMRDVPKTKKDLISRFKADPDTSKQTKVSELRKIFSQLVNDANSLEQAESILLETGLVDNVTFKAQKSGNKYLQVKTTLGTRNINLRGKGFEQLEKLYYSDDELQKRSSAGKYQETQKRSMPENQVIWERHRDWWLRELKKREPVTKRTALNHEKSRKKFESYYEKYTKEQRLYFVIYRNNIHEEAIRGYRIFRRANEKYLVNSDLGVKIYDRPSKINIELPGDPEKRRKAIALALSIAQDKGWNLRTMEVSGSIEFRAEVKRQIDELTVDEPGQTAPELKPEPKPKPAPQPPLNGVDQALDDAKHKRFERLSKDDIAAMKAGLDAQSVIDYAAQKYGLLGQHFSVTSDNKIDDDRTKAKPKSVVDFLVKTCNVPISESITELQNLYTNQLNQEAAATVEISICTGSNPNGLSGWKTCSPKTFTELTELLKSHPYAAFSSLEDDYRKIANVRSMCNVAIFDIDNDPDAPQLSLDDARQQLASTSSIILTSKSHQIDKVKPGGGVLPAVDRYRVLVPLQEPLSADRDEYRLSMMKLAEDLNLAPYADPKALKDIARQYYPSPKDAEVIINKQGQAYDVSGIKTFAVEELARMEAEKAAAREAIRDRVTHDPSAQLDQTSYPLIVDLDALNRLPLPEIYQKITGRELEQEGSYLMSKGVTAGTSQSRNSFTVFQDGDYWLWHDFKSGESGNVVTFMSETGTNVFKAAQQLADEFSVELIRDNPDYYATVLKTALKTALNDKDLETKIKEQTGANFVKLDKITLKIADKEFSLHQFGLTKGEVITAMRENRSEGLSGPKTT